MYRCEIVAYFDLVEDCGFSWFVFFVCMRLQWIEIWPKYYIPRQYTLKNNIKYLEKNDCQKNKEKIII